MESRSSMITWCILRAFRQNSLFLQTRYCATQTDEFVRITVPQKMMEKLQRHNLRKAKEKAMKDRLNLKTLVISSKRKEYQFYKGQKFDVFDPKQLASHGWKNRKCKTDHFTLVCHKSNPAVANKDLESPSFDSFPLDREIKEYLMGEGIRKPTNIQNLVIPKMLDGRHILCAAETGSGKTYAYLLPIVHNILKQKRLGILSAYSLNAPHSIIMVPSMELGYQIMEVCEKLSEKVSFKPLLINRERKELEQLHEGKHMDVLICTPGILLKMFTRRYVQLSNISCIVLDEADTLLDDSFNALTGTILRQLQIGNTAPADGLYINQGIQVALVSATFPKGLESTIGKVLPVNSFCQLTTNHLHHLMPHVQQKFMKMKSLDKLATILSILKKKTDDVYMVFCNKHDTCVWLSKSLEEMGISNVCITGNVEDKERNMLFRSFLEGEQNVLVCTDLASRGIDTHMVNHVINFDFPNFMSDYIHRAGRVGRVGAKQTGLVTNFVVHPWDVDLVWKIEIAARRQTALHNVNANIKRKIKSIVQKKGGLDLD